MSKGEAKYNEQGDVVGPAVAHLLGAVGVSVEEVVGLVDGEHLGRVADPAGGSYAVEKLTDDLALAAWEEREGRIDALLSDRPDDRRELFEEAFQ